MAELPTTPDQRSRSDIRIKSKDDCFEIRSVALTILVIIALVFTMQATAVVIVPIVLAIVLSFLLSPIIEFFGRFRIPPAISAALVLVFLIALVSFGIYRLIGPAATWIDRAPATMREVEWKLRRIVRPLMRVSEATRQVEEMTESDQPEETVTVTLKGDSFTDTILTHTRGLFVNAALVIILLYFLLASGDMFLHKLVRVQPRLSDKKRAVEIVRRVKKDISTYLFTITLINISLGAAVGAIMYFLGMPNPMLWGALAAALNFIPYLGALVGIVIITVVAIVNLDHLGLIIAAPASYVLCTAAEGYFITPAILGVRLSLNPVVIIIGLLFWGWMWGITGAVLAVPLLAIIKIICDRFESLSPIGEFLAGPERRRRLIG